MATTGAAFENIWISRPDSCYLYLFELNDQLDDNPEYLIAVPNLNRLEITTSKITNPLDLNGDRLNDLLVGRSSTIGRTYYYNLGLFFGDNNFDFEFDWQTQSDTVLSFVISGGFDVNNDSFDDIIIYTDEDEEGGSSITKWYYLYFGGDQPSEEPHFCFNSRHFGSYAEKGFSMLQDVNDDGYDDWVIHFIDFPREGGIVDGSLLFFGSEDPDYEPDVILDGGHNFDGVTGGIAGGDFNGDGIGDIVISSSGAYMNSGQIDIHLGSRWIDHEPEISMIGGEDYGQDFRAFGKPLVAVGDYNGDGIDDFIAGVDRNPHKLFIFSGNRDWEVSAPSDRIPEYFKLEITTYPLPFNDVLTLEYTLPIARTVKIIITDIKGRIVNILSNSKQTSGKHQLTWQAPSSGIFLVKYMVGEQTVVKKVVCVR